MLPGVGIIGTNSFVKLLIPILNNQGFHVNGIWSHSGPVAEEFSKTFNIPHYSDKVEDILLQKDIKLIFIACPPHLHSQVAVQALGIGKHVVCDIPLSVNGYHVTKMIEASQYYPSLVSVLFYTLRYLPSFIQMRKAIENGFIGEVTICEARIHCHRLLHDRYDWMCERTMGGGLLTKIGSHIIDILTYLTGKKACRVHGIMHTYMKNVEFVQNIPGKNITSDDFCTFQMELEQNAFATVTLNSNFPGKFMQEILICGTKGHLVIRGADLYGQNDSFSTEKLLYLDVDDSKQVIEEFSKEIIPDSYEIQKDVIPKLFFKSLIQMISALKKCFSTENDKFIKDHIAATFEDGQYVQTTVEAIRQSSQNKEWVKIEYPGRKVHLRKKITQ